MYASKCNCCDFFLLTSQTLIFQFCILMFIGPVDYNFIRFLFSCLFFNVRIYSTVEPSWYCWLAGAIEVIVSLQKFYLIKQWLEIKGKSSVAVGSYTWFTLTESKVCLMVINDTVPVHCKCHPGCGLTRTKKKSWLGDGFRDDSVPLVGLLGYSWISRFRYLSENSKNGF